MSISVQTFMNGLVYKLRKTSTKARFTRVSWAKEKLLKHQDDRTDKTIRLGKLTLHYKRPYEVLHTYKELFEDEIYNFTAATTTPFIIDCGANIGLSVLYFKSLYPQAKVLAFEPDKDNFALLQENIQANQLSNVDCRQHAVWINNDVISFASDGTQGSQIATKEATKNIVEIKADRLADILKIQKVDFLKIDIEGAEVDVLKDCEPYLNNVQNLFVEYHGKTEETEKLFSLLEVLKHHYKVYIKMAADNLTYPFVMKSTGGSFDVQLNIFCYQ